MSTEALSCHLEALEARLDLCRSLARQAGKLLRAKRVRPEARNYVEMLLDELSPIQSEREELARALRVVDAVQHAEKVARIFRAFPQPSDQRKAPRLAGTEREENFDAQSVAMEGVPVNGQTPCDAAQRQEVRDAH